MRYDMHARWIEPEEEWLVVLSRLVKELDPVRLYFVVNRLHPFWTEFARVFDPLLSDLAPAGLHRRIVHIGRVAMNHVARSHGRFELLRIIDVAGIFHCVEVIEIPIELIEPVHRW